ncbi:flagellar biosynthesis protein FlhF [Planctomycetes bacterium K23_9]|uniref:Flagellar biosynthesis protein FlhF n=1 Tax=Stieleria marina TaxID=1930275 RepID=A0A517NP52_9BACT|nr:Flagellar biosynthesis protein FlhF [Planctomycetes bacterium K23_9]
MPIKTFRAASLQDALEDIRREMGPDASVLETRQVREGWMGWLGNSYVEVKAEVRGSTPVDVETTRSSTEARTDSRRINSRTDPSSALHPSTPTESIHRPRLHRGDAFDESENITSPTSAALPEALPSLLQDYQNELISLGVCPQTAHRWMSATTSFAASFDDMENQPWLEHLHRSIARELRFAGPIRIPPGSRHTVALVGPTGVGKTTTVAKLAAGFRLESKRRVGLVTIDTFRIAAVQQLKAYAEIMDLPMQVVETADDMRPAIDSLGDVDLVLIDTAGRSPRSDARIDQLSEMLRSAQPDETHLVLSATSSTPTIRTVLEGFMPARPTAVILTKLDEAPSTAAIVSEITTSDRNIGMPVSYLTNGQQVPDDIRIADVQSLLARLLPTQVSLPQMDAA